MSVRANWHLADLDSSGAEGDQFDIMDIADRVIELDSADGLHAQLSRLVHKEAHFYDRGVRCDLKQNDGRWSAPACNACPHHDGHVADGADLVGIICRVGRQQEDLVTRLQRIERRQLAELTSLAVASGVPQALDAALAANVPEAVDLAEALVA